MKRLLQLSLALFLVTGLTTIANAQVNTDNITATANVQAPLTVVGEQNLTFGNIISGNSKTIQVDDGTNAGKFSITGPANSNVTTTLSTPTDLTNGTTNTLPISYTIKTGNNDGSPTTTYSDGTQTLPSDGDMWIFIGATANASSTPAGSYSGTISLNATYN